MAAQCFSLLSANQWLYIGDMVWRKGRKEPRRGGGSGVKICADKNCKKIRQGRMRYHRAGLMNNIEKHFLWFQIMHFRKIEKNRGQETGNRMQHFFRQARCWRQMLTNMTLESGDKRKWNHIFPAPQDAGTMGYIKRHAN